MNRFLKRTIVFLIPVLIIILAIELYLGEYPSIFQLKADFFKQNKHSVKILVLGSSHNQTAINPDYLSLKAANIAFAGQDLKLDYSLLKKYLAQTDSLKYVFLELAYHSLEQNNGSSYERNCLYLRFYGLNNFGHIPFPNNYSIFFSNPQLYSSFLNPFKKAPYCNKYGFVLESSTFEDESHRFKTLNYNETAIRKDTNNIYITRHRYEDSGSFQINSQVFTDIIRLCLAKNITPVVVIPPVYISYYEAMLPTKKKRRDDLLASIKKKFPQVLVYDSEYPSGFTVYDFMNEDHLNPEGARIFTLRLNAFINSGYAIANNDYKTHN